MIFGVEVRDILLVIVAFVVMGIVAVYFYQRAARERDTAAELIRLQMERDALLQKLARDFYTFSEAVTKEVGKDSGTSLATRLHQQDDKQALSVEVAAKKDETDKTNALHTREAIEQIKTSLHDLSVYVERMERDQAKDMRYADRNQQQDARYAELLARTNAEKIINVTQQGAAANANAAQGEPGAIVVQAPDAMIGTYEKKGGIDMSGGALHAARDVAGGDVETK